MLISQEELLERAEDAEAELATTTKEYQRATREADYWKKRAEAAEYELEAMSGEF